MQNSPGYTGSVKKFNNLPPHPLIGTLSLTTPYIWNITVQKNTYFQASSVIVYNASTMQINFYVFVFPGQTGDKFMMPYRAIELHEADLPSCWQRGNEQGFLTLLGVQ